VTARWEPELDVARRAVERAGKLTLEHYGAASLAVEYKADASPVTVADRGAETLIRAELAAAFPDDGVAGEEFPETTGRSGRRWIIDPIDGTASFIRGVPLWGVLVGLEVVGDDARGGRPSTDACVVGVAAFPALGETYWGARGAGAYRNSTRIHVASTATLADATILTTDVKRQWFGDRYDGFLRLVASGARQRGWGDCYGYAAVASGRGDVMVDPLLNPWDIAALVPIIEEAGGTFSDWTGAPTIYAGSGVATTPALRDQVLTLLRG
jgi:histidinol phosphatase-like enzyme (inositol monophosphatase family)